MTGRVRLAVRLLRGGGRAALVRIGLMTVGVALLLTAAFAGAAVSRGLASAADRANGRAPIGGAHGTFEAVTADDYLGLTPVTLVRVTAAAGATPPAPPGCASFPAPGHGCLAPALSRLLRDRPGLARRLGVTVDGPVAATGLAEPDELIAYVGQAGPPRSTVLSAGWGRRNGVQPSPVSGTFTTVVLLLLVGLPGLLFLTVCARLSAAARARRTRVLRLLGADARTVAAVSSADGRVAGVAGLLLALAAWAVLNPWFAGSGLAGFRWFPAASRVPAEAAAVLLVLVPFCVGRVARAGLRRSSTATSRMPEPAARWRTAVLWLGVLAAAAYFWHAAHTTGHPSDRLFLGAAALLAGGLLLALRPAVERLAGGRAPRARSAAVRLSWRRLEYDSTSALRLVTGLAILVLVATIGSAVGREVELSTSRPGDMVTLTVDAGAVDPAARNAVAQLPALHEHAVAAFLPAGAEVGSPGAVPVTALYASCAETADLVGAAALPGCRDGQAYRVRPGGTGTLRPGDRLVDQAGAPGPTAPAAELDLGTGGLGYGLLVAGVPTAWPAGAAFTFTVAYDDAAAAGFQDRLAAIDPALVAAPDVDLDGQRAYRAITGIVRIALGLGFLLGLAAFAVAAVDRAVERRREVAHLTALGIRRGALRLTQLHQLVAASALGLVSAALVGQVIGEAYLVLGQQQRGWYWPSLWVGLALAATGCLFAAAAALPVYGRRTSYALLAPTA